MPVCFIPMLAIIIHYRALAERCKFEVPNSIEETFICYNMNGFQDNLFSTDFVCIICRKFNGMNFGLLCKHMEQVHDRFRYSFSSGATNSKPTITIHLKQHVEASDDDSSSEIEYFDDSIEKFRLTESNLSEDLAFTNQLFLDFCDQKLGQKIFLNDDELTFMVFWNNHILEKHSLMFKINKKTALEAFLHSFIPLLAETIFNSSKKGFRDYFVRLLCSISTTHQGILTAAQIGTYTSQLDQILKSFREKAYNKYINNYFSSFYWL